VEHFKGLHSKDTYALSLAKNITLSCQCLAVTNTLAYDTAGFAAAAKRFVVVASASQSNKFAKFAKKKFSKRSRHRC
jgi:hypothetical protein